MDRRDQVSFKFLGVTALIILLIVVLATKIHAEDMLTSKPVFDSSDARASVKLPGLGRTISMEPVDSPSVFVRVPEATKGVKEARYDSIYGVGTSIKYEDDGSRIKETITVTGGAMYGADRSFKFNIANPGDGYKIIDRQVFLLSGGKTVAVIDRPFVFSDKERLDLVPNYDGETYWFTIPEKWFDNNQDCIIDPTVIYDNIDDSVINTNLWFWETSNSGATYCNTVISEGADYMTLQTTKTGGTVTGTNIFCSALLVANASQSYDYRTTYANFTLSSNLNIALGGSLCPTVINTGIYFYVTDGVNYINVYTLTTTTAYGSAQNMTYSFNRTGNTVTLYKNATTALTSPVNIAGLTRWYPAIKVNATLKDGIDAGCNPSGSYAHIYSAFLDTGPYLNVSLYDAITLLPITSEAISVTASSTVDSQSQVTSSGHALITGLYGGNYTVRAYGTTYQTSSQIVEVVGNVTTVALYMTTAANQVIFRTTTGLGEMVLPNVTVRMSRLVGNVSTVVASQATDTSGRTTFSYVPNEHYFFLAYLTGYINNSFELNPIQFSQNDIKMTANPVSFTQNFLDGVTYYKNDTEWKQNQNKTLGINISSPAGYLYNYNVTATYLTRSAFASGSTATGSVLALNLNTTGAVNGDMINLTYRYTTQTGNSFMWQERMEIINASLPGTIERLRDDYGLGAFEKVVVGTLILLVIVAAAFSVGGTVAGFGIGIIAAATLVYLNLFPIAGVVICFFIGGVMMIWRIE